MPPVRSVCLGLALIGGAVAQFPPKPEGLTVLNSKYHEGVTISYKEPGICETTPGVKSYSGYVHLPPGLLSDIAGEDQDYPINTFFWFFESRKDPANAPLSIWLNGGPGGSSLMGLLQENGPCFVGSDSNSTVLNAWSWNNEVNMLYIDQPSHVGFSYDVPRNGTFSVEEEIVTLSNFTDGIPAQNLTHRVGTFPSGSSATTANSTIHAAHAIWHFAQTWFSEFPFYKPEDDRISLWTESYGGHYGPGFLRFFQEQNEKIRNGTIKEKGTKCLLMLIWLWNNTYGIKAFTSEQYEFALDAWSKPGGCRDGIIECQKLSRERDPHWLGKDPEVNEVCVNTTNFCGSTLIMPYIFDSNNGWYDITHPKADPFPEPYLYGYLTESWVQAALGVPVNYSSSARSVSDNFQTVGDWSLPGSLEAVSYLLESGVKVHMVYGDRDFACNWIGGELASLAVNYSSSEEFKNAGYAPILAGGEEGVFGGMVRQYGNFSFSRVFQAGHEVPSYAPAVSYEIFMRALFNTDIATGLLPVSDTLSTIGPSDTWSIKNEPEIRPKPRCYVMYPESCTPDIWEKAKNGTLAVGKDYFVIVDDDESTGEGQARLEAAAAFAAGGASKVGNVDKHEHRVVTADQQKVLEMPEWREEI